MQDSPSFFSDSKVIVSLFAISISIASFLWTLANQWEQNRRWDNLNAGNPEVKEIKLINWKEITKDEAFKTQWGYEPLIYSKDETNNLFVLPYTLTARNVKTKERININTSHTLAEIDQELKRINFHEQALLLKLFRPKFIIENMGKTEVRKLSIKIDAKLPNEEWHNAFTSSANINLAGSQTCTLFFDFEIPFDLKLPRQISFKIHMTFNDANGLNQEKVILAKWTTNDNFWSYEPTE